MKTHSLVCLLVGLSLCLGARSASAQVLAQYGFEGTAYGTDSSGNGHNGTAFNVTSATGVIGTGAGSFNGTSSYVDLGNTTMTGPLKPALPITITAWVYLKSTTAGMRIFSGDNSDNSTSDAMMAGYDLGIAPGGLPECDFGDAGGSGTNHQRTFTGTAPLLANQWYNVAAVIQGASNMQLYVNGQLINGNYSGTGGAMTYTTASSKIGTSNSSSYFNGYLDDVRVYNAAMTGQEISLIAVGALGYWTLGEGSGTTTADQTGDGFTGTLVNNPVWTNGLEGSALGFNGTNSYVNLGNGTATNTLKQALPISINGLIYLNSTNGVQRIVSGDNSDNTSIIAGYDLSVVNGQLVGEFGDGGGAFTTHRRSNTGTIALAAGQWYDVSAIISSATNITLYVNGVNATGANSGSGGSIHYTGTTSKIGQSGSGNYFNGTAQDIGVYGTALTPYQAGAPETIGGGTTNSPAVGPPPSFGTAGTGFTLVKNWHFGTDGTITNLPSMHTNFWYHDLNGTVDNGGHYGAMTLADDSNSDDRIAGQDWVGETVTNVVIPPVRQFYSDSLRTYVVPIGGVTNITVPQTAPNPPNNPPYYNAGCGSFEAKWTLPAGGSKLGQDILWETRVRYVTPPGFWFSLWTVTKPYLNGYGPEHDVLETFGYNNTGTFTNYNGEFWHSNTVGGSDQINYTDFQTGMSSVGINSYDATQYHIWQWLYRKDDTYAMYVDGTMVQYGSKPYPWTSTGSTTGTAEPVYFNFDATWGDNQASDDKFSIPASELNGTYYEFNYSRVYLR